MFDIHVRPVSTTGHVSLEVGSVGEEGYFNLADVGFGFSQLLPLVAQIHSAGRQRFRPGANLAQQIIAVEQPELHLHPAYQARLAELFVDALASSAERRPMTILLETHSEALVGRIGELIASGAIERADVIVHFIEKDEASGSSTITKGEYGDDGIIENWPVGFFSAR
jgi:predicted ATPase